MAVGWRALPSHLMCELDVLRATDGGRAHCLEGICGLGHSDGANNGKGSEEKDRRP